MATVEQKLSVHSNGSTPHETIMAILCCFLHSTLTILLGCNYRIYDRYSRIYHFVLDFCIFIIPSILSFTLLEQYLVEILVFQASLMFILIITCRNKSEKKDNYKSLNTKFITNFRAMCNILSVLAILAVDFSIFPRRFAKTATFGFSLMDAGVGLFVFSNGIVSPEARNRRHPIKKSITGSIPLLLLGLGRFILTKQTDYKIAVSEYGIHWNFFITLATIKIFSSLVLNVMRIEFIYINASLLIVSHEIFLQSGVSKFVLGNHVRDSFLKANKEGIASALGYVSLYLFSVHFGHILHKYRRNQNIEIISKFICGSFIFLMLTVLFENYFGISRRLANAAYCFWILFISIFFLGCLYISQEFISDPHYTSFINEAVNYNGLAFFLIGNVLTGSVNLTMNASEISSMFSLLMLVLYMLVNCSVICVLYYKKIRLKISYLN